MVQMGLNEPVFGFFQPGDQIANGGEVAASTCIHPRVEAEIAVRLRRPLRGPGCPVGQVLGAIGEVMVALAVSASRYENFNFDLKSVIADNTSAAGWVVGDQCPLCRAWTSRIAASSCDLSRPSRIPLCSAIRRYQLRCLRT